MEVIDLCLEEDDMAICYMVTRGETEDTDESSIIDITGLNTPVNYNMESDIYSIIQVLIVEDEEEEREEEITCSICLCEIHKEASGGEAACMISCGHIYHLNCIQEWHRRQKTCPIDRRVVDRPNCISYGHNVAPWC